MCFNKHGSKSGKLCPVSFGLAIGIVCSIASFLMFLYLMRFGVPTEMMNTYFASIPTTWAGGMAFVFLALLKGFFFGFFVALLYDLFVSFCPGKCCKKTCSDPNCPCGCMQKPNELPKGRM